MANYDVFIGKVQVPFLVTDFTSYGKQLGKKLLSCELREWNINILFTASHVFIRMNG